MEGHKESLDHQLKVMKIDVCNVILDLNFAVNTLEKCMIVIVGLFLFFDNHNFDIFWSLEQLHLLPPANEVAER